MAEQNRKKLPSKQETLRKLSSKRVPKAIKALKMVGNLASYEPSTPQVNAILTALQGAYEKMRHRLSQPQAPVQEETFNLPG